jgi:hypothetical protein
MTRFLEYLFMPPGPVGPGFDRWGGVLLGAFAALALAIWLLTSVMYTLNARHGLKNRVARRIRYWGGGLQLLGVLLLGLRLVNWPVLSMRLLLYAHLVAEVAAAGYLLWWLSTRFPARLAAYEWEEKKRAYLPRAAGGTVEAPRRKAAAGRRR